EIGWRKGDDDLRATYTAVHDELRGNGPTPESLLAADRSSVYTQPDIHRPDLHFLNLLGERKLGPAWTLDADAFFRNLVLHQSTADVADAAGGDAAGDEGPLPGVVRRIQSEQRRFGGALQAAW